MVNEPKWQGVRRYRGTAVRLNRKKFPGSAARAATHGTKQLFRAFFSPLSLARARYVTIFGARARRRRKNVWTHMCAGARFRLIFRSSFPSGVFALDAFFPARTFFVPFTLRVSVGLGRAWADDLFFSVISKSFF